MIYEMDMLIFIEFIAWIICCYLLFLKLIEFGRMKNEIKTKLESFRIGSWAFVFDDWGTLKQRWERRQWFFKKNKSRVNWCCLDILKQCLPSEKVSEFLSWEDQLMQRIIEEPNCIFSSREGAMRPFSMYSIS